MNPLHVPIQAIKSLLCILETVILVFECSDTRTPDASESHPAGNTRHANTHYLGLVIREPLITVSGVRAH